MPRIISCSITNPYLSASGVIKTLRGPHLVSNTALHINEGRRLNPRAKMASPILDLLARLVPDAKTPLAVRQKPDPDRIPRVAQAAAYRDRTYYCIAAFIAIISIFHWTSRLLQGRQSFLRKAPRARGSMSIKRFPAAFMNTFRALAFRQTLHIGSLYTINVAEFMLTAGYITLVFTISMMNCTSQSSLPLICM